MWKTVGFESQKAYFEKTVPYHTYLFVGPDKIGKRTFALELASKMANSADILEIALPEIEAIRGAKQFLSMTPFSSSHKIVIIDNAGALTDEAQNTLLKILEEPSLTSVLVLIAKRDDDVLATIISRCHVMHFSPHSRETIMSYLGEKQLSEDQKDFLYRFSNGSIGLLAGDYGKIKVYAEEYNQILKADTNKRFDLAKQLSVDENLNEKVLFWMLYLHTKKNYASLSALQDLYATIIHPQYSEQLALENFMLRL